MSYAESQMNGVDINPARELIETQLRTAVIREFLMVTQVVLVTIKYTNMNGILSLLTI